MGNCCCCCCDEEYLEHRRRGHRTVNQEAPAGFRAQRPPFYQATSSANPNQCRICQKTIDSALLEGHEQSCRAQMRRRMRMEQEQQQRNQNHDHSDSSETAPLAPNKQFSAGGAAAAASDVAESDPDRQCVICLDNRRVVALLPCSHLAMCIECSKMVDSCPLCRGPKESMLIINEAAGKCRVCKHYIVPTFLDSHQEVCRMRMKELRKKLQEESEKSDAHFKQQINKMRRENSVSSMNAENHNNNDDDNNEHNGEKKFSPSSGQEEETTNNNNNNNNNNLKNEGSIDDLPAAMLSEQGEFREGVCLNCLKNKGDKFSIPCGHRFCTDCLEKKLSQCPVCLRQICSAITVYE